MQHSPLNTRAHTLSRAQARPQARSIAPLAAALLAAAAGVLASTSAQAAPEQLGAYAGAELARARFGISSGLDSLQRDRDDTGAKLYGGYRFTPNFGVEAGYAALGSFSETASVAGSAVQQTGKVRSLYTAATGLLPLSEALSLRGKLGVSWGKVSGNNLLPAANDLTGSKTSLMGGLGLDYKLNRDVTLTLDYDHYGKVSDKLRASSIGVGAKLAF